MNSIALITSKGLVTCAVCAAFSTSALAETNNNMAYSAANYIPNASSVETIEVLGQINTLLVESDIELSTTSSPDLRKQLTQFPSLHVNGNGLVTGIVQYRGMYSDRVQVSIDDTLIAGAGPNGMDSPLTHVMGALSQQVTLYQGIAPVSAGAETIGGAVDISEIAPLQGTSSTFDTSGALTLGWFSNDSKSASGALTASNNSSYFSLSGDRQSGDDVEAGNGVTVPNTFYDRYGAKIRMGYEDDTHKLDYNLSVRNTNESGTPTLAMDIIFIDALISSLHYEYTLNENWAIQTKLSANNNEHVMDNYALRPIASMASYRINTVNSQGRAISSKALYQNNDWENEYGLEYSSRKHNSRITNPNASSFYLQNYLNVERELSSVYGQIAKVHRMEEGLQSWQVGARLSRVSANADNIDTSMAMMMPAAMSLRVSFNNADKDLDYDLLDVVAKANLVINDSLQIQGSLGRKEQAPMYSQLYTWFPLGISAGLADGRNYLGNLNLEKESANKIDISAIIKGDDWRFIPSVFYSHIDDYIIGLPSSNMPANMIATMNNIAGPLMWQNDEARISGFDFTFSSQLSDALSLRVNGQFVRGKQTGQIKQDLYRIAPMSANVSMVYAQDEYEVNVSTYMVAAQNKVSASQNETATPGYAVFDLSLAYYFDSDITLTILAENLLDKNYAEHLAGINRVSDDQWPAGNKQLSKGRNIGAYLSYQF